MKLILLIDDEEPIRKAFGAALRGSGYRVIDADCGQHGLEMARRQMPDLILSDINMPGLDGQALLSHIRADPALCSKQVVLMTGRPDLVPPRTGMEQGADDFLVKPITLDALISCVSARLRRAEIHWRVEDRVLSKISSSMSTHLPHEFITPLAGILGLSEILQTEFSHLTPEEMQDFHQDIHKSALRLHRTVKNYLLVLELQNEPEIKLVPAAPLSRKQAEESLETGVEIPVERHDRRADLTVDWSDSPIQVKPSDLSQIVEELLDNAFKFSRTGTPVEIKMSPKGVLLVSDAGRGMTDEEIGQIGAFRQFDRKKHEQQGLGLGLIIVQKLTARNGATCSVTRREGQGIQVRVEFQVGALPS